MLLAGELSTLRGVSFAVMATGDNPTFSGIVLYTAAGGVFLSVQAWVLARRRQPAPVPA